jgi:hypothetical protein
VSDLNINIPPELERRLQEGAQRRGVSVSEFARSILERGCGAVLMPEGPADLEDLAREQGAPLAVRFEDLIGDFWPEEETRDQFIAALREWRREGTTHP